MLETKISNALANNSFTTSFKHLKLRKEHKEEYLKVGARKVGLDYRIVKKIMCFLKGGYAFKGYYSLASQKCVNLNTQEQGQGLLKNLSLKKL